MLDSLLMASSLPRSGDEGIQAMCQCGASDEKDKAGKYSTFYDFFFFFFVKGFPKDTGLYNSSSWAHNLKFNVQPFEN